MLFSVLARKTYARNLQYRASHAINTVASGVFGLVYVCIWNAVAESNDLGTYGAQGIVYYAAMNQTFLWITSFLTNGLGIAQSVRTGQISLDLMRPVHLFYHLMSKEWGQVAYQTIYKTLPIYVVYVLAFSIPVPVKISTWLATIAALVFAAYISICINYLIGVTALWTTESGWLYWVNISLSMVFSGFLIPVEWLPGGLRSISEYSPYPYLQYVPTRLYLEMSEANVLAGSFIWCVLLTLLCFWVTSWARQKVEVQGG